MNPNQIVFRSVDKIGPPVHLTRGDLNVLLGALSRARMEILADPKMNHTFKLAWVDEIDAVMCALTSADMAAAPVLEPTPQAEPALAATQFSRS